MSENPADVFFTQTIRRVNPVYAVHFYVPSLIAMNKILNLQFLRTEIILVCFLLFSFK